jgi:excisionase family DNA binding protein
MASLYRPKVATYRLKDGSYRTPDGKRVTRRTPGAVRVVKVSEKWYGRYTDGAGRPHRKPLAESKEIARRMLAKLAGDSQLAGVGIADPFADHRGRPLAEHLEDFRRFLAARDNCAEHVRRTAAQAAAVLDGCGFRFTDDIDAAAVAEFLAERRRRDGRPELPPGQKSFTCRELAALLGVRADSVNRAARRGRLRPDGNGRKRRFSRAEVEGFLARRRGLGVETSNHYLTAAKQFTRWLAKHGRTASDPLAVLSRQNAEVDVRHERRALGPGDFAVLVAAARRGKPFRGISGNDRAVLYVLAGYTGLRCSELGSLTPASFDLDADPPTVTVGAAYSKHRRRDVQALRLDVAALVGAFAAGRPRAAPLWPGSWTTAAAEMIRQDLAAAGIPYADEAGRVYDFHALRHQFISDLARAGVAPRVAQELARHSTITLTMNVYSHIELHDQRAALEKLPRLPGANPAGTGKARSRRRIVMTEVDTIKAVTH